ncbi:uncharacterized protein LACBIDRAFT_301709 [Laccaria bicolor S238N-H82]|uniref:Predicted protein n=1 Tax=Laccaria bicolor (strain S238N-H82 / ATCC MYA-4686) TaxID=486041 RepID=B0CP35_LACBS|nr:uncharacterized protein LACBIDRAFT_301709 [Laccaria bicolor S238N-H82]EDR15407.1 predicted protein [Laccaria bicolor S238N-H82]|eukprot:XP_001873615.1 predicted protein [Laccaria bicolor S238N-H82]
MEPTPDLSHLTRRDYDRVYEPAEDTFLLLDALELDANALRAAKPQICLEIGSGSGCVSTFLAKILGPSVLYLCTDINFHACRCTFLTGVQNQVILDPINTSLDSAVRYRLVHGVDIILFNPPYVPTSSDEAEDAQEGRTIEGSWAGGFNGMELTNVFLERVEHLMSLQGKFYLVAVKQNDIEHIRRSMLHSYGLKSEIVLQRRAGREHLFVVRFTR